MWQFVTKHFHFEGLLGRRQLETTRRRARQALWEIRRDIETIESLDEGYIWGSSYGLALCSPSDLPPEQAGVLRGEFVRMHDDFRNVNWLFIQALRFVDTIGADTQHGDLLAAMLQLTESFRKKLAIACKGAYPALLYRSMGSSNGFTIVPETEGVPEACLDFQERLITLMEATSPSPRRSDSRRRMPDA